jgi:hypothetical protein
VKCAGGGLGGSGGKLGGKLGGLGKGKGLMTMIADANNTGYVDDVFARTILQNGCGEEEKGHRATGQAHMAYNRDGYYVEAAACYIVKKFKGTGGGKAAVLER